MCSSLDTDIIFFLFSKINEQVSKASMWDQCWILRQKIFFWTLVNLGHLLNSTMYILSNSI